MALGKLGCGASTAKIILFVFNFLVWLAGIGILGFGIWAKTGNESLVSTINNIVKTESADQLPIESVSIVFIITGSIIFFLGFCGCLGALKEIRCLLGTYIFFMVAIILMEVAATIYIVVKGKDIESFLSDNMSKDLNKNYDMDAADKENTWNTLFQLEGCCGVNGVKDFNTTSTNTTIPKYCCTPAEGRAYPTNFLPKNLTACMDEQDGYYYKEGCLQKITNFITEHKNMFLAIGLSFAGVEIFGLIFAIILCRAIGKEYDYA